MIDRLKGRPVGVGAFVSRIVDAGAKVHNVLEPDEIGEPFVGPLSGEPRVGAEESERAVDGEID
ncbi:MAG: hypothetical protein ACE5E4_13175, partial [Candidatus Binatia bacterium]